MNSVATVSWDTIRKIKAPIHNDCAVFQCNTISKRASQACGSLLERLFPFGTRTFLRMVLSAQKPTGRPSQMESFMEEAFNDTRRLLAERVMLARWFNPVERVIAREKLADAQFAFMGAVRDLNVPTAYYDPNGPYFDGTRLVRSYVEMQAHTRRIYYRPMTVGRQDWDFDNRCDSGSVKGYVIHNIRFSHHVCPRTSFNRITQR